MVETADAKALKLLSDLLALVVSDNAPQSEAALHAIRRRAERDGVTGSVLKDLIARLPGTEPAASAAALSGLRWTLADQKRELEQVRLARRQAETTLSDTQHANASLAQRLGRLDQARRQGWAFGFLIGGAFGFLVAGAAWLAVRSDAPVTSFAAIGVGERNRVEEFLHSCFLSSSNSLGGGAPFALHLMVDVDTAGRIAGIRMAADQLGLLAGPDRQRYSAMVLRTFANGSCGPLPLPASLAGRSGEIDVHLPG